MKNGLHKVSLNLHFVAAVLKKSKYRFYCFSGISCPTPAYYFLETGGKNMKKGTVLSLKKIRFSEFIMKNNVLVLLVILFIAGIAAGTFAGKKIAGLTDYSAEYLERFVAERSNASFLSVTVNSFAASALVLLAVFAAGTSVLGVVLVPIAAAARCVLYGSVSALLYSQYSVKGIAFNAVLIIPAEIIFAVALLLAAKESVKFSLDMARLTLPSAPPVNLSADFRSYCSKYILICLLTLLSAITDAVMSCSFGASLAL